MSSDGSAENESMDVAGSFVSVNGLEVLGVTKNVILINDTIATEHISSLSCDG